MLKGNRNTMGKINYRGIFEKNQDEWKALTREPQKYEALLAGHYSESNHFVYELLQNAEDERADRVVIEYFGDKLVFYHNGDPFDEEDVRGVSSMLMGTKDRNSAQTIGRFGMGFKSVFKYTYQPEIYSDDEAFQIQNYLLPVEISDQWDFKKEKEALSYKTMAGKYLPFVNEDHLTKIVIPFLKRNDDGTLRKVSGKEVLLKLEQLSGEILLFLNHIKKLYWINKLNGKFAMISLDEDQTDTSLVSCRIEGTAYGGKEEITRYLKFKQVFDHPEMKSAEVSVAYKLNNRVNNINELSGAIPVWVYFPTRDMTTLPFYIHGSFETAVSREKLMTPSDFNSYLFDKLGDLIKDSLLELKKRNLITQVFIRRILLAAFRDEADNDTIPGLREKVTSAFGQNALLPDRNGKYRTIGEVSVPVPFGIHEFADNSLFRSTLTDAGEFVAFNNEREANFNEYFGWLTESLHVRIFSLADWATGIRNHAIPGWGTDRSGFDSLEKFYDFLTDNRVSLYTTGLSYSRSGRYEQKIRETISGAWEQLLQAPIILNAAGQLVSAYHGKECVLYLSGSNDYQTLMQSAVVDAKVADKFGQLMRDGFQLSNFDNFQYVKEKVIRKYVGGGKINFETDDTVNEYVEDINQIIALLDSNQNVSSVMSLLSCACIIRVRSDDDKITYALPTECYLSKSAEGMDLSVYFAMPSKDELESDDGDDYYYEIDEPDVYPVDEEFYSQQGISLTKLQQFGLITTPVVEGKRSDPGGPGQESWRALGEYCPRISVNYIDENLRFIQHHFNLPLARKKSAEILKLMFIINEKLSGTMRKRKSNPYEVQEESYLLTKIKHYHRWLYDKSGNVHSTSDMSKFELDENVYGPLQKDKAIYARLGFKETTEDNIAEAFDQVDKLNKKDKTVLLRQLARELGMKVSDSQDEEEVFTRDEENGVFDGDSWVSDAFPISRVRNMESLIEHVRQQFFCADPVKYQKVLRQIRTSKSARTVRAYVTGMYVNDSNMKVCQMCKRPVHQIDATEIANFGIELPQLNLCLCRECSGTYKGMRDANKEAFKEAIKQAILGLNLEEKLEEYEVQFNSDTSLHFTETHVAEVQTIFGLISEFGIPGTWKDIEEDKTEEERLIFAASASDESGTDDTFEIAEELYEDDTIIGAESPETEEDSSTEITASDETEETMTSSGAYKEQLKEKKEDQKPTIDFDFMPNTQPIKDGDLVSYKKINTLEIVDAVMDSGKYPLHKNFIGKKIGDLVVANGKRFLIVSIL